MTQPQSTEDYHLLVAQYALISRDELLAELARLMQPSLYKEEPSADEMRREGEGIWRSLRGKLAVLICKNRKRLGSESLHTLLAAGAGAFMDEMAKNILGTSIVPDVTAAVAVALAGLLYKDLQAGVDAFCDAYYFDDE